uniref:Ig-like domain-containing protein n=1 Tax=Labrus bergylta TaxID=56723 RepID=A0A3Q3EHD1_9LABR
MARLELIIVFALLFEVRSDNREHLYRFYHPDQDVTLPCGIKNQPPQCSRMSWLYNRDSSHTLIEASRGKIEKTSLRADRLSLDSNCSLVIKHITAEDVGFYTCRLEQQFEFDVNVFLSLLTVSQLPADSDQTRNSEVTLECSLLRYIDGRPCQPNGLHWLDETGTEVTEGVQKLSRGTDCVSHLKVKNQSGDNRKFTCQFVQRNKVEIQADYPPDLIGRTM